MNTTPAPVVAPLDRDALTAERDKLRASLEAAGGRGVDLAERIDRIETLLGAPEPDQGTLRIVGIRDGQPVVNVKDGSVWASDARTAHFYGVLTEQVIERVYQEVLSDFWSVWAPAIAQGFGYGPNVYAAGRSGGWLKPDGSGLNFLEYLDADDPWTQTPRWEAGVWSADDAYETEALRERDTFLRFAAAIAAEQDHAESQFVERLDDELADLNARREACIIRGEN